MFIDWLRGIRQWAGYTARRRPKSRNNQIRIAQLEHLELRTLLSAAVWDGEGDGSSWSDNLNWAGDTVPADGDDIFIGASAFVQINGETLSVNSLTVEGSLGLNGGTLTVAVDSTFSTLVQTGGEFLGEGTITVDTMQWIGGTQIGTGDLVLLNDLTVSSGNYKVLGRRLENHGSALLEDGGYLYLGLSEAEPGAFENLEGATVTALGESRITYWTFEAANVFQNAGTFLRGDVDQASTTLIDVPFNNTGTVTVQSGTLSLQAGGTSSGSFTVAADSMLSLGTFGEPTLLQPDSTISGAGLLDFSTGEVQAQGSFDILHLSVTAATVDLVTDSTFDTFEMLGGTVLGTGTITVGASMLWTQGELVGSGSLISHGDLTIRNGNYKVLGRLLENHGSVLLEDGSYLYLGLSEAEPGIIENLAGATVTALGESRITYWTFEAANVFQNAGAFLREDVGQASTTLIDVPFNNTGTVSVQSGTLSLQAGGTSSGSFTVAADSMLSLGTFGEATLLQPDSTISGAGLLDFSTGEVQAQGSFDILNLSVTAATVDLATDSTFNTFEMLGGTVLGTGTITVDASMLWTQGELVGSGSLISLGNLTVSSGNYKVLGRLLENHGSVLLEDGSYLYLGLSEAEPGIIDNLAGATVTALGENRITYWTYEAANAFQNAGTFLRGDVDQASTLIDVPLNNTGTVSVQSGTLGLQASGTSSGSFTVAADAVLSLGTFGEPTLLQPESTISGAGLLDFGTGEVQAQGSIDISSLRIEGGTILGAGTITVNSSLLWEQGELGGSGSLISHGVLTIRNGSQKVLGRRLENHGSVLLEDGVYLYLGLSEAEPGIIDNLAGATVTARGESRITYLTYEASNAFQNAGTFTRGDVEQASTTLMEVPFNNTGTVSVQSGTLSLQAGGTSSGVFTVAAGAALSLGAYDAPAILQPASNISGAGLLDFSAGEVQAQGSLAISSLSVTTATVDLASDINLNTFEMQGGLLLGTGTITVDSSILWVQGELGGSGSLVSRGNLTISTGSYKVLGRQLVNQGSALFEDGSSLYVGLSETEPGIFENQAGAAVTVLGDNSIIYLTYVASNAFLNAGTFVQREVEPESTTFIDVPFNNTGTVSVQSGTLNLQGGGTSPGTFIVADNAVLSFNGVSPQISEATFQSQGTVQLRDLYNEEPLEIEAPGRDLGNAINGFQNGNRFSTILDLTGGVNLRLVDHHDTAPGTDAEAVYVDYLLVGSSTVIDLNGLHLYARAGIIEGTILNGTVEFAADGGPLGLNWHTPGQISAPGEVDEWTVFARAGQSLTIVVDPGSGNVTPIEPTLQSVQVTLVGPSGQVIATTASQDPGTIISLLGVAIPSDGTYKIQIQAPETDPTLVGNYQVTAWNASIQTNPLVLNQTIQGTLATPYSLDRWEFVAAANQQVDFRLWGASNPDVQFSLLDPLGNELFSDLSGDSGPTTLPFSGKYVLQVYSNNRNGGSYSGRLDLTTPTVLQAGVAAPGELLETGDAQLFRLTVLDPQFIVVHVAGVDPEDEIEVYVRRGAPPTRRDFDYKTTQTGAVHDFSTPRQSGDLYVLVYAHFVPDASDFSIQVDAAPLVISQLSSQQLNAGGLAPLSLTGAGFLPGMQVELVPAAGPPVAAQTVQVDTFDRATVWFDLTTVDQGDYTLRVTLPDNTVATAPAPVSITATGQAQLHTELIVPEFLGRHGLATIYIEVSNTGTAPMPAPVLILGSSSGSNIPLLSLDFESSVQALDSNLAGTLPSGVGPSVQVYATGAITGYLLPGEKLRIPVYYGGLKTPWGSDSDVHLSLLSHAAGNTATFDWSQVVERPSTISPDAWSAILGNLSTQVGTTWGDYVLGLNQAAIALARLGIHTTDVADLYGVLLQQADAFSPISSVAVAVDASLPAFGEPIELARTFGNTISDRYEDGLFGRGWSSLNLDSLEEVRDLVGTGIGDYVDVNTDLGAPTPLELYEYSYLSEVRQIVIHTSNGGVRVFTPSSGYNARGLQFYGESGDSGILRRVDTEFVAREGHAGDFDLVYYQRDVYELTESNGLVTRFLGGVYRAVGYSQSPYLPTQRDSVTARFEFVQDAQGNRVTAGYADETALRPTTLTSSNGPGLTMTYDTHNHVTSVVDSAGRTTTYAYDASGEHLLAVTGPQGTTVYTYVTGQGAAREHALASVTVPGGLTRFFDYDESGRLSATYLVGQPDLVTFSYPSPGEMVTTTAAGITGKVFLDQEARTRRVEDGQGNYTLYDYDAAGNLATVTDTQGLTRTYTWRDLPQLGFVLESVTDELHQTTSYQSAAKFPAPTMVTDARGNSTRYTYDSTGNLTSTVFPDKSRESITYDAQGRPVTIVDRLGEALHVTYNAAGLVTSEQYADGSSITYVYDARGRLTSATNSFGTTAFTYDAADQITRIDQPSGRWVEYDYDQAGRRTEMRDQAGSVTRYGYDAFGRLSAIRDGNDVLITSYTYDASSRLAREDKGNGTYTIYTYTLTGQVGTIQNFAPNGTLNSQFAYSYNSLGQQVGITSGDGVWSYTYDPTGQLIHAVFASTNGSIPNQDLRYEYDAVGNRIRTISNGVTVDYSTNVLDQYTSAGTSTFEYDLNGNLVREVTAEGTRSYFYNAQNQLIRVDSPAGTWQYEYDAFGHQTAVIANGQRTEHLFDLSGAVVADYNQAGNLQASYVYGFALTGTSDGSGWRFYDFDAIGSTVGVTSSSGGYVNQYAYDPFGNTLNAVEGVANRFQFVGQFSVTTEGNGLTHMGARVYNPQAGRFTTTDPLGAGGGDTNLYRYAGNNPVSFIDPSGLAEVTITWDTTTNPTNGYPVNNPNIKIDIAGPISYDTDKRPTEMNKVVHKVIQHVGLEPGDFNPPDGNAKEPPFLSDPNDPFTPISPYTPKNPTTPNDNPNHVVTPPSTPTQPKKVPTPTTKIPKKTTPKTNPKTNPPPTPPGDTATDSKSTIVQAVDPNQKTGAAGYGPAAYIADGTVIPYRIDFENLGPGSEPVPEVPATAPAQRVEITDQLDTDLDWSTLRFTEAGFGTYHVLVDDPRQYFFTTLHVTINNQSFDVQIELSFDRNLGRMRAVFQSIDPSTLLPPDVLTGFLIPEDGLGSGKGFVSYSVQPKAGLATGTEIRNVALITFDFQQVIATNQIDPHDAGQGTDPQKEALNTIDAGAPDSQVEALPAITTTASFVVSWSGSDDLNGSGIATYTVYVSDNGGQYTAFVTNTAETSAVFTGEAGHTYAFYSVARDHVGHTQVTPVSAQATTSIPVNTAPTVTDGSVTIPENQNPGAGLGTVIANDPDAGQQLTYSIIGGNTGGAFAINPATGEITVANAAALDFETTPTWTLTVQATDNGSPNLSGTATFTVQLTDVNEVPVVDDQTFSLSENSVTSTAVGTVVASDPDAGTTLAYSITGGNTGGAFAINSSTGEITVADAAVLDFETTPTFTLTVQVSDGTLAATATITVNLTNVNEAPVLNDSTLTLAENSPVGAAVGVVTGTDPDASPTLSYSITGGNTSGVFAINSSTGEITVANAAVLDFETTPTFTLTVQVSDGTLTDTATITVNLTNVNEAPVLNDSTLTLAENSPVGTAAGVVTGTDPDASPTLSYSITGGNTGGAFAINSSTGEITVANASALDFETTPTFTLTVQVSDGTLTDTATVTIHLTNVNEAPVVENQSFTLAENTVVSSVVGTVAASDPDASPTLSYSITDGNTGGAFAINSSTGEITVANAAVLDFETTPTFTLTVQVSDGTLTDTATVTINLTNVNEAPVLNDSTLTLAENSPDGTAVGSVTGTDPDAGSTLTYSITGGNPSGAFAINSSTGEITVANASALDFETTPTFHLTVQLSDGTLTDTATVTINLTNVNETPVLNDAALTLAENSPAGTTVGFLTGADPDANTTLSYSITGGNTSGAFAINSSTGEITVANAAVLDFETMPTFTLTVQISDGTLTDTATVSIELIDVVEAPELSVGNDDVTWIKKQPPAAVVPQLTVSGTAPLPGGTLTVTINAVGTSKKLFDLLQVPSFSNLGTGSAPQFANGRWTLQIQLGAGATNASIEAFLRGIKISTKGKGLKTPTRQVDVQLTSVDGGTTTVSKTINVLKKKPK